MKVEVAYATPEQQWVVPLELAAEATVADALAAVASREPFASLALSAMPVGVYGEVVGGERKLQDGDRVELYRPLIQDPKEARRQRAARDEK